MSDCDDAKTDATSTKTAASATARAATACCIGRSHAPHARRTGQRQAHDCSMLCNIWFNDGSTWRFTARRLARENVSRVLSDLKKRGVIEQRSQSYMLNDIGALEREVHH